MSSAMCRRTEKSIHTESAPGPHSGPHCLTRTDVPGFPELSIEVKMMKLAPQRLNRPQNTVAGRTVLAIAHPTARRTLLARRPAPIKPAAAETAGEPSGDLTTGGTAEKPRECLIFHDCSTFLILRHECLKMTTARTAGYDACLRLLSYVWTHHSRTIAPSLLTSLLCSGDIHDHRGDEETYRLRAEKVQKYVSGW